MATAIRAINNQIMQPYSSEAMVNPYSDMVRTARRRGQGRTALLTRGQRRGSGAPLDLSSAPLATAAQMNPVATSRGEIEKSYTPMKNIYEFGKTSIGRIYKKQRNRTDFLGLSEDAEIGDAGFARLRKGQLHTLPKGKRGNTIKRRSNEANNLIREYRAYVKKFNEDKAAALAQI